MNNTPNDTVILSISDALAQAEYALKRRSTEQARLQLLETEKLLAHLSFEQQEILELKVRYYFLSTMVYHTHREYTRAILLSMTGLRLSSQLKNKELRARVIHQNAHLLDELGNSERALAMYREAYQLLHPETDFILYATILDDLAVTALHLESLPLAEESWRKLLEAASRQVDHAAIIARAHDGLGRVKLACGQYEDAERELRQARDLLIRLDHPRLYLENLIHLLKVCRLTGKGAAFQELAREGLARAKLTAETTCQVEIYLEMWEAKDLLPSPSSDESPSQFLLEALRLSEQVNPELQLRVCQALAKFGQETKNYELAFQFCHRYHSIQEQILEKRNEIRIHTLEAMYEAEKARRDAEFARHRSSELATVNQRLQKVIEEKNAILGIAIHDLKNPLGSIINTMQLLYDLPNLPSDYEQLISSVHDGAVHMFQVIDDLLEINRMESGAWLVRLEQFSPQEAIQQLISEYDLAAKKKNQQVFLHVEPQVTVIHQDRRAFRQIFDNLISNALKFTPPGKSINITLQMTQDNRLQVSVRDEGPGLTDEDRLHLFQRFKRLSARPTSGEKSTGLGLSIVKMLVDVCQGEIQCQSKVGQGAEFIVKLPDLPEKA